MVLLPHQKTKSKQMQNRENAHFIVSFVDIPVVDAMATVQNLKT
jgi:hypothetical protein